MGYFFSDHEITARAEAAKKKREQLLAEFAKQPEFIPTEFSHEIADRKQNEAMINVMGLCPICKEHPIWINGQCWECFIATSN